RHRATARTKAPIRLLLRYRARPMLSQSTRRLIAARLADEVGRVDKDAPLRVALTYPSPDSVGMSSLGCQSIYREMQGVPGVCADRAFLPDGADKSGLCESPYSHERPWPRSDHPVIAVRVAYELGRAGRVRMLDASRIPPLAADRH